MIGYTKRSKCASCNSRVFDQLLDLGVVPLAGYFPTKSELGKESKYPLSLIFCSNCKLVQTDSVIDPDILFKDYRYISSIGLKDHFQNVAHLLDKKYEIKNKKILEIGCNDGVLLKPLVDLGAIAEGVDPAENITKIARSKGLKVHNTYFNYQNFNSEEFNSCYDLVLSNNAFAHIIDIVEVVKGINFILKEDGHFVFEVHYLGPIVEENQWDSIYHEHIYYYSLTALKNLFDSHRMTVVDFEEIPIHSGSIRVTVENRELKVPKKVLERIELESSSIANSKYLQKYKQQTVNHIAEFKNAIKALKEDNVIAGYGASGRANMFCNLTDLDHHTIKYIVDESPERSGRHIANTSIPIVDFDLLNEDEIDLLIIFAWNYSKMIMEKTSSMDLKYLVAFPFIQIVEKFEDLKGFDSL